MARKKQDPGEEPTVPATARPAYDAIVALTDAFCREHLDGEYEALCRKLAGALARKRPSPLLGGKPTTWACGIVRTIGWVNYLDDRSQKPHMKLTAIDKAFGVGESDRPGQVEGDPQDAQDQAHRTPPGRCPAGWTENPMAWMIEINGFIVDARILKREFQEEALRKGLIPYIPADRAGAPAEE